MPFARLALLTAGLALLGAAPAKTKGAAKKKGAKVAAPPPGPAWLGWKPGCRSEDGQRDFVAVGRSAEGAEADAGSNEADDDGRQRLGEAIAAWQESTLRCAKKASESKVTATSSLGQGSLNFSVETATAVTLYKERVEARAPDGKRSAVLMKHDLGSMLSGIDGDAARSNSLREAVRQCGSQAFDELAGSR